MNFFIAGRGWGKTTQAIDWVLAGKRTKSYPGWNRILLVHSRQEEMRLHRVLQRHYHPNRDQADASHRIFSYSSYLQGRFPRTPDLEIAIDNVDIYLRATFGNVVLVTATTGT